MVREKENINSNKNYILHLHQFTMYGYPGNGHEINILILKGKIFNILIMFIASINCTTFKLFVKWFIPEIAITMVFVTYPNEIPSIYFNLPMYDEHKNKFWMVLKVLFHRVARNYISQYANSIFLWLNIIDISQIRILRGTF